MSAAGFSPPLQIGSERQPGTIWMEVMFDRKKGQHFAHSNFGTAIVPDSDEMVRCSNIGMIRSKMRTCAFRACYDRLDACGDGSGDALRHVVNCPAGFAGVDDPTVLGYSCFEELETACRASGWAFDASAINGPLFPKVNAAGLIRLGTRESFTVAELSQSLKRYLCGFGLDPAKVGLWSMRKDACEEVACNGDLDSRGCQVAGPQEHL